MHFLRPYFLLLFIPFACLMWHFFRSKSQTSLWKNICSKELMPYVLLKNDKSNWLFYFFTAFVLSLLILAASGPAWDKMEEPTFKRRAGVVIVLDLSESMNAEDVKPSRLKRAIYKISDFLNQKKEGQTALIAFSEKPFVVTPLTDDVATILAQLPVLETKIMPSSGHHVDKAIEKAIALLKQTGTVDGSILLVTGELSQDDLKKSVRILKEENVTLSVLGVGKEERIPIPKIGGGFLKDKNGSLLMTSLDAKNLKKLADEGRGIYSNLSVDDSDIHAFMAHGKKSSDYEREDVKVDQWKDVGYFFVMLSLPFFSLIFRKGLLLLLCVLIPQIGTASIWTEKKAEELFNSGFYEEAKELFENPDWKASAHYKLQEYELAAELFKENQSIDGLYNYGTAKAKLGDFENALTAYSEVLKIDKNHEDALHNKKIIEEYLEKQKSNSQSNESKNDKKRDDPQSNRDEKEEDQGDSNQSDSQKKENDKNEKGDPKDDTDEDVTEKQDSDQIDQETLQKEDEEELMETESQEENDSKEDQQKEIDARWLQLVPDDPGGLLRRKFLQQYHNKNK